MASSISNGYGGPGTNNQIPIPTQTTTTHTATTAPPQHAAPTQTLPFTGFDVLPLVLVGAGMAIMGAGLRVVARR